MAAALGYDAVMAPFPVASPCPPSRARRGRIPALLAAAALPALLFGCDGADTSSGGSSSTTSAGGAGGSGAGGSGAGGAGGGGDPAPFRLALSVSPFPGALLQSGATLSAGQTTATTESELQQLYMAHGANEVFARISTERATTTAPDDHSLETALRRAALAAELGLPFNPELGLWAHYGDILCQPPPDFSEYPEITVPGEWHSLTADQMVPVLRDYAALVAAEILATSVTVNVWDIGNEVDLGMAGVAPTGMSCSTPYEPPAGVDPAISDLDVLEVILLPEDERITWLSTHVWPHQAKLFAAVVDGIRQVDPSARFSTHMSQSLSASFAVAFYKAMADGGFLPDEVGFSFYPTASQGPDRAARFRETVESIQTTFSRPVFIAEVAYPSGPITEGPYQSWTHALPSHPITPDGQASFFRDLTRWAPVSGVSGIRPWAPDVFVPGWEGMALFSPPFAGPAAARPALSVFPEALTTPDPEAFHD